MKNSGGINKANNHFAMTQKDEEIVNEKLVEAHAILEFLNTEYGFNYSLQYTKQDKHTLKIHYCDHMHSKDLSVENVRFFMDMLGLMEDQMELIPEMIRKGELIVKFVIDAYKPEGIGAWPVKNALYKVLRIRPTENPKIFNYELEGLTPNPPYDGYSSQRFQLQLTREKLN